MPDLGSKRSPIIANRRLRWFRSLNPPAAMATFFSDSEDVSFATCFA